jgi:transposase-like protein
MGETMDTTPMPKPPIIRYTTSWEKFPHTAQPMKYVSDKDRKAFANDLKTIYNAPSEQEGREALDEVTEKWQEKYPRAMKRWYDNWDAVSPIFTFSNEVWTVIYTTNAIERLNLTCRRLNSQRSVFPSDTALLKALYLSTFEATKKWTLPIHN